MLRRLLRRVLLSSLRGILLLTKEQIEYYHEEGYLLLPDILESETLVELRRVTEGVVSQAEELTKHSDFLDLEPPHEPNKPRVRRIKRPHLVHPFYKKLASHRGIIEVLIPLLGEDIRMRPAGKINMKSAGFGSPVEWHQDWAFYPHTNQNVLAVGILLDDMNADNGPLLVLPYSHKGPVYDHHDNGVFCGAIDVVREGLNISSARELWGRAGTITIHHARLVHGSASNHSNEQRRILFYEYASANAWPLGGIESVEDLEEFNSRVVQGEPTLQPRLEEVPVRMPLPIDRSKDSIYEKQKALSRRYFNDDQ